MKKLTTILFMFICFQTIAQDKGLEFTTRRKVADKVFGLLDAKLYGSSLINRSLTADSILVQEIRGDYDVVSSGPTWLQAYSDIAVSYTDPNYMYTDSLLLQKLYDFIDNVRVADTADRLLQPFGLLLHQTSVIDTFLYKNEYQNNAFVNQDNQLKLKSVYNEDTIYRSVFLKSAALLELYGKHGYQDGTIVYAPDFISTGSNIDVQSIQLDLGTGFQPFGFENPELTYHITQDWQIGEAAISYTLNGDLHRDTLSFYLSTEIYKYQSRARHRFDKKYTLQLNNLKPKLRVGIRYGCGNGNKIRRPVIIVPPYRPSIQPVSMNKYWDQFDYKSVMSYLSDMGYDVIFIKEKPGNRSISHGGTVIAKFINYINEEKKQNYPHESWENIVIGYSAGGQQLRYALKKLEKEHIDGNGPAHHCRLYIPFDSPNWGANVPMFAQVVYNDFNINILALIAKGALNDPASRDMLINHYRGSTITQSGNDRIITPHPAIERTQLTGYFQNSFNTQFTPMNDLRKTFPLYTRNVAVSTGNNGANYHSEYGLSPGKELFKQNFAYPALFGLKDIDRRIYASQYGAAAYSFKRKDVYMVALVIPVIIQRYYRTKYAYEWDMAQGGYKDIFFNGIAGATTIMRLGAFGLGKTLYKSHVSFMPLVSALAINPNIWKNNNLYYNLKNEGLMYNKFGIQNTPKSNFFGYPHLGHPNNHFNITPFEAVFSDNKTYEHIKMQKSAGNNVTMNNNLVYLRDFILNEVEAKTVYFQNQHVGSNHAPNATNFTYTAWYKSSDKIVAGDSVTPKTDVGDYVIEPTANVTMYACNSITLKPGFHAKAGSTYHAFIRCDRCSGPVRPLYPPENKSLAPTSKKRNENGREENFQKKNKVVVYPNPTKGKINSVFPKASGWYIITNLQGQIIEKGKVNSTKMQTILSKGIYILKWNSKNEIQTKKIIVL